MRRSERREIKRAATNFDACALKSIEFKLYARYRDRQVEHVVFLDKVPPNTTSHAAGYLGVLICPRTVDQGFEITSQRKSGLQQSEVLSQVRELAAQLVCRSCPYINMTPAEASLQRANFARAETERLQAFALREEAISEIEQRGINFTASDRQQT
jgi:hypothetical protein